MAKRNDDIKYKRYKEIPEKGLSREEVIEQSELSAKDSLSRYDIKETATKPGTLIDPMCLEIINLIQGKYNPNAIDPEMFRGTHARELEVIAMTSKLFGKEVGEKGSIEEYIHAMGSGFLLSGGSESINQALWMYRNKFFLKNETDLRKAGAGKALLQLAINKNKKKTNMKIEDYLENLPTPRILAPVNLHFSEKKGTDILGLGTDSITYYDLDEKFNIDFESLERTVRDVYEDNDDIIMHFACGGDVNHGKVHDVRKATEIIRNVSKEYGKDVPPTAVDAAGSYLFLGVMQNNSNYDGILPEISFKIEDLEAIIGDPHKQPMPYSCGMLMLKNWRDVFFTDMNNILNTCYLDVTEESRKIKNGRANSYEEWLNEIEQYSGKLSSIFATIPTSRSGSNVFAVWSYYMSKGLSGLRESKEKIWGLVKDFKDYIQKSDFYDLVCDPQTQVVSFKLKKIPGCNPSVLGDLNEEIYSKIKYSDKHFHHISKDDSVLVRKYSELERVEDPIEPARRYKGLFVTVMEHNTQEGMNDLKKVLDQEGLKVRRRKTQQLRLPSY